MAALSLTKQALSVLGREKPHSSITDLVEILTSPSYDDEAFDGIPELVESINLQPTGPAEASRAIRKKLKHGDAHRQYRALVLLKATVENGGQRFQTTFADGQLTDAIKHLVTDPGTDPKVKRKLISVLGSWNKQFQGDPRMSLVANLYKSVPHAAPARTSLHFGVPVESESEQRKREERATKEEAKRKAKEEKRRKEEEARQQTARDKRRRTTFNFEKEKPQILQAIAETSQVSNNLVNALTLVNPEHERVQDNERVKECLENAKLARKRIVRYIQLVENEELIGTLLETNERVIAALQMYDKFIKPVMTEQDVEEMQQHMAAAKISDAGELSKLQARQRVAVARHVERERSTHESYDSPPSSPGVHPDLQDLSFGTLGTQGNLPPPLRPDARSSDDEDYNMRGSLSDFSDYASSDEETHNRRAISSSTQPTSSISYGASSSSRRYAEDSNDDVDVRTDPRQGLTQEDPFADPFGDQQAVSTPGIAPRKGMKW